LVALAILMGGAGAARAQTGHPASGPAKTPGPPTTIEALVTRALAESPAIVSAWARVDAAKGNVTQAALRANPELMTDHRRDWNGMGSQTSIGIAWPLELGRRQGRTTVAIDEVAQAALSANEVTRQVSARVRIAAIRALAADRQAAVAADVVESHHQWCDLLEARVKAGSSAPIDRDIALVELKQGQVAVTRLNAEAAARWADLKAIVGLDPSAPITITDSLEDAVAALRRAPVDAMADGVVDRPDVAGADAAIEIADAKQDLARREGRLDLRLSATYMRTAAGFPQFGTNADGLTVPIANRMNEFMVGATVMLPLRNRNQGLVAAAAGEKKAAESDREAVLLSARAEIAAAEARDREAGQALEIYTGGLLALAKTNLDVVRQSFELGRINRIDVSMEERRYLDVQTAYVAALQDAYEARVVWTQALGGSR
jgi:cobalt-zinc-cadmium efflux system outer membrane protein